MQDQSEATPFLRSLVEHLREQVTKKDDVEALRWIGFIRLALRSPQIKGGMSGWVEQNNDKMIESLEAKFGLASGTIQGVTRPAPRKVRWYKFNAQFGEAEPWYYKGVLTIASTTDTYIGFEARMNLLFIHHSVTMDEVQKV